MTLTRPRALLTLVLLACVGAFGLASCEEADSDYGGGSTEGDAAPLTTPAQ
jgi:hypothetical protein